MNQQMRVALIHDWLNGMRGGEKVLEVFCELFPQADLYTLFYEKGKVTPVIANRRIVTSFIGELPWAREFYRYYLPFFPRAVKGFDLEKGNYDLVLSSSHCVAKGVLPPLRTLHICYCFTPMRYVWAMQQEYLGGGVKRWLAAPLVGALQRWDRRTSETVHRFVAISQHVAERIRRFYGRDADVIYPPVDAEYFSPSENGAQKEDFYLIVSALVPYKRIHLAVEAFNRLGRPLHIVGAGTELGRLRRRAKPNIRFLGWQPNDVVREQYRRARALIFPGEEDFGIAPLEAMACATPVIAYGRGGLTETVRPVEAAPATGLFFYQPTAESLVEAVRQFEKLERHFDPNILRTEACRFDRRQFKNRIESYLRSQLEQFQKAYPKARPA